MPCLGGNIIVEQSINGKTYLCGTRGLIIADAKDLRGLNPERLAAKIVCDQRILQKEQARRRGKIVRKDLIRKA